ncbi:DUF4747 family protein [Aequorivita nionensis]|jgi:hypothetical protein|uniref:DUF4747 family protein n=1 Tax=Aequorivita nionensis TaxID=1287690 RepID=UPI00396598D0
METFYFGRLNYKSKYDLFELLNYGNKFRDKNSNTQYGIFSIETIEDKDLGVVFSGELVKYQDIKEEPVVKDDILTIEYIRDYIQGRARFFLIEKNHLIAYNPYGNIISPKRFCEAFSGVIIGADDTFNVDSLIYPINQEYEFMNFLQKMRSLNKLTLKLTPSNPNSRDLWKDIDERLNNMHVKVYTEEMQAMDNESIVVDEITESKIKMAQDGYGKAKGEGKDEDGNEVTISTEESESIMKKKIENNLMVREQFFSLKNVFEKILRRFNNK